MHPRHSENENDPSSLVVGRASLTSPRTGSPARPPSVLGGVQRLQQQRAAVGPEREVLARSCSEHLRGEAIREHASAERSLAKRFATYGKVRELLYRSDGGLQWFVSYVVVTQTGAEKGRVKL